MARFQKQGVHQEPLKYTIVTSYSTLYIVGNYSHCYGLTLTIDQQGHLVSL
jgi:hypothetical protein